MKRTILSVRDFEEQAAAFLAASKAKRGDGLRMEAVDNDEGDAPGEDDDTDDDEEPDDDADESGDDKGDDKSGKDKDKGDDKVDRAEYERVKRHRAAADRKAADAQKKVDELTQKLSEGAKGDTPETTERVSTLEKDLSKKDETIQQLRIQNAFLAANEYSWHDAADALRLADLSDVEIEEDGTVVGLKEALRALAKSKPHLIKKADDKDEKRGPSGSANNGKRKGAKDKPDRTALSANYPILRNRA